MSPLSLVFLFVLSSFVTILLVKSRWGQRSLADMSGLLTALFVLVAIIGGMLLTFLSTQVGPKEMTVERKRGEWRVAATFPTKEWLWRWNPRVANTDGNPNRRLVSYARREIGATMRIEPITPNPKVRETQYEVVVQIGGTPGSMLNFLRSVDQTIGRYPRIGICGCDVREYDWLKYHLYEFNERHGQEIGAFYNPINRDQQEKFSQLTANFLDSHLRPAQVRFKKASFQLKEP